MWSNAERLYVNAIAVQDIIGVVGVRVGRWWEVAASMECLRWLWGKDKFETTLNITINGGFSMKMDRVEFSTKIHVKSTHELHSINLYKARISALHYSLSGFV